MVDDFMLDDSIVKSKGNLGEDILNNIIRNLNIADEAIEEACHEINKHDELYEMKFESFENDIRDFNEIKWKYYDFKNYAEEYDALVDTRYKDRMESICNQLSDIRLENIQIDNNLGIIDPQGSHYDTFGGTRLKYKINIEDILNVDSVDEAMKAEHEQRRSMVEAMAKMVNEDSWPEGTSEDTKEAIRQYVSNLNGGKMESYEDEIKNLLTQGNFNFITEREQNLSLALDFVPIVGDIKGAIEACTGKEMITNRELSDEERLMAGISSAVGFIPGVGEAGTIAKAGTRLGAKAAIKEAATYAVKETIKGAGVYEASKAASDLGISPKDQLMAIGGMTLYRGGRAVLKNPVVINAVSSSKNINKYSLSGEEHYQALKDIFGKNNIEWISRTKISQSERLKINNWDFTPSDELYIKYKDVYNNELYYNQATGKINWPSNYGFLEEIPNEVTVNPSMILDRYGEPTGQFMANATDSYESRALAPHSEYAKHYYYRPTEEFTMDAGTAAPWFGSNGGATQYLKYHSNGELYTVEELLHDGLLDDITDLVEKGLINFGE